MYPQTTYMDFNIGSVLKLVTEAEGVLVCLKNSNEVMEISESSIKQDYLAQHGFEIKAEKIKSGATCLLDGLGADEIFSGY